MRSRLSSSRAIFAAPASASAIRARRSQSMCPLSSPKRPFHFSATPNVGLHPLVAVGEHLELVMVGDAETAADDHPPVGLARLQADVDVVAVRARVEALVEAQVGDSPGREGEEHPVDRVDRMGPSAWMYLVQLSIVTAPPPLRRYAHS